MALPSNWGYGSFKVVENYTIQWIMYHLLWSVVVSMALSRIIFELFDIE